jgi:hypothetical protein
MPEPDVPEVPAAAEEVPARRPRDMELLRRARKVPRCCHVKANGLHCGSPALRSNVLCYFHDKWLNSDASDDVLPPLEDGNGVQFSLMYVASRLRKEAFRDGQANIPAVKQLLYALQTASHNLRHVNFDPKLKSSTTNPFAEEQDERVAVEEQDERVARPPSAVAVDVEVDSFPEKKSAGLDLDLPRKPVSSAGD